VKTIAPKSKSNPKVDVAKAAKNQPSNSNSKMKASQLMKLFETVLKDIYWAEKTLTKAMPKMIKNATSHALREALINHLEETKSHVTRVEKIFEILDKKAVAVKCEATAGLLKEAVEIMVACEAGAMCDAGIISAAQKMEHYEIATYGTLRQFAVTLGLDDIAVILLTTLEEEKEADVLLSEVAMDAVNVEAAEEKA
jgi:ferritin-like metal-binding protein YciE